MATDISHKENAFYEKKGILRHLKLNSPTLQKDLVPRKVSRNPLNQSKDLHKKVSFFNWIKETLSRCFPKHIIALIIPLEK